MSEIIFVNPEKHNRAIDILALVSGKRPAKTEGDAEIKDKFTGFLADADVKPKGDDAVLFIYEKLGGLVRTQEEEKKVAKRKKAIKKEAKDEAEESEGNTADEGEGEEEGDSESKDE